MTKEYLDGLYDENLEKLSEIVESKRWAAKRWLDHCWSEETYFRITEAFRSQERQDELYKIGRNGKKGEYPVTWTRHSKHTQRLAVDIIPVPGGYVDGPAFDDIEKIAAIYGIAHPFSSDQPHFEFDKAREPIPPLTVLLRMTIRQIVSASGAFLRMLTRKKNRIEKRLTEETD